MIAARRALLVAIGAVAVTAWAAPVIRLASAPPIAISAWRCALASLVLVPLFLAGPWRAEWARLARADRRGAVTAGLALALHFAAWITAVTMTSVAAASALVALSPVLAMIISQVMLGERASAREVAGSLIAVAGMAVVAAGDWAGGSPRALLGDLLAVAGALCSAFYLVVGRRLRGRLSLVAYVTPVYAVSAVVLMAWAVARGEAFGPYPPADWLAFAALAAGPMLLGHTGLNYALRYLPAYRVSIVSLGEPVISTLIAWLLPAIAEAPGPGVVAGGVLVLIGIALALSVTGREAAAPVSFPLQ